MTRHNKALRAEFDRLLSVAVAEGTRLDAADVVPALLALVDGDAEQLQAAADEQRAGKDCNMAGAMAASASPSSRSIFSRFGAE